MRDSSYIHEPSLNRLLVQEARIGPSTHPSYPHNLTRMASQTRRRTLKEDAVYTPNICKDNVVDEGASTWNTNLCIFRFTQEFVRAPAFDLNLGILAII